MLYNFPVRRHGIEKICELINGIGWPVFRDLISYYNGEKKRIQCNGEPFISEPSLITVKNKKKGKEKKTTKRFSERNFTSELSKLLKYFP